MHSLKLLSLHCHVPDESDLDEVYLKTKGVKIWPQSAKYQQIPFGETTLNLNIENLESGNTIVIELWDHDSLSMNDNLGSFTLPLDQSGKFQTELKKHTGSQASYSLEWEYY